MNKIDKFRWSYLAHENYPCNLLHQPLHTGSREGFKEKLKSQSLRLFRVLPATPDPNDPQVRIRFRDFHSSNGMNLRKYQANSNDDVDQWLGDGVAFAAAPLQGRNDPRCRFVFLRGESTRASLYSTLEAFQRIASYHQVMPEFIDLLPVLGVQVNIREAGLFGFRELNSLHGLGSESLDVMGRSAQHFQICYTLRSAAISSPPGGEFLSQIWTFRAAAIHHQFHQKEGTSLWLTASGNDDLYRLIWKMTHETEGREQDKDYSSREKSFVNSLRVHLAYANWALGNWRAYIEWLNEKIEADTRMVALNDRSLLAIGNVYDDNTLSRIHRHLESITQSLVIISGNLEVIRALKKFYTELKHNKNFTLRGVCKPELSIFTGELRNIENCFEGERDRCFYLSQVISARKDLVSTTASVSIEDFNAAKVGQHLQGQTNRWARKLSDDGLEVARHSYHQAIVMKIIAAVTLFYLPATFVSTFFSTDVVKYQGSQSGLGSYSPIAMWRWLQVTAPLTVVTGLVAIYFWLRSFIKTYKSDEFPNEEKLPV